MIKITKRQHEVLGLLKSGIGRRRTAKVLSVHELTVMSHIERLMVKGIIAKATPLGPFLLKDRIVKDGRSYRVIA